jgi:predicted Rossmann-fold nucleotide-binding protein
MLAALLLASPLSAQVVSVKTSLPAFTGAPGVLSFQAPALNPALSAPVLAASLAPSLAPALIPVFTAPAVPGAVAPVPVSAAAVPASAAPVASLGAAVQSFSEKLAGAPVALLRLFDGAASVGDPARPASFDDIPPLDARYTGPESRARTVTVLGSSKSVDPIKAQIGVSADVAGELIRRGYNVLTGAGNAGVMGAAYAAAAENANAAARAGRVSGENLVIAVRPAWGDENLADARAIGIADSEAERIEKFARTSDSFLIFPGSAGSLQEAATLIAKNAYRGKAPLKRIILVGRDFFGGLSQQYHRLFADGLLKESPEALFRVVDTAEELLAGFAPLGDSGRRVPALAPYSASRAFADSAHAWLASSGAAFDAKNTQWADWTENPGPVSVHTKSNLRAIRSLIDNLQVAKIGFAREAASVPATGELTPESVRRLYDAWDRLRAAANATLIIVADSNEADPARRGLMANIDQNTLRHPGGFEVFLAPGLSVDWDAARALNDVLRAKKP